MYRLPHAFMYTCILALVTLLCVSLLWTYPVLLTVILVGLSILMLMMYVYVTEIYLFIVCAISGAAAEAVAIYYGAWTYNYPSILGIPYWLPLLWGMAGVYIRRLSVKINEFYA